MKLGFGLVAAACVALAAPAASAAMYTFDFTGAGGNLSKIAGFADTTNTTSLTAHAINTEMAAFPYDPVLHQTGDGIGVNLGFLDLNEIDNRDADEGIVFDLGGLGIAQSAGLNDLGISFSLPFVGTITLGEAYRIYGSNDDSILGCGTTGLGCLTAGATLLASGSDVFDISVNFSDPTLFRYIIATVPGGSGDSYRVSGLTVDLAEVQAVPLPAGLPLLLSALLGTGFLVRRRAA